MTTKNSNTAQSGVSIIQNGFKLDATSNDNADKARGIIAYGVTVAWSELNGQDTINKLADKWAGSSDNKALLTDMNNKLRAVVGIAAKKENGAEDVAVDAWKRQREALNNGVILALALARLNNVHGKSVGKQATFNTDSQLWQVPIGMVLGSAVKLPDGVTLTRDKLGEMFNMQRGMRYFQPTAQGKYIETKVNYGTVIGAAKPKANGTGAKRKGKGDAGAPQSIREQTANFARALSQQSQVVDIGDAADESSDAYRLCLYVVRHYAETVTALLARQPKPASKPAAKQVRTAVARKRSK